MSGGINGKFADLPFLTWRTIKHASSAFDGATGSAHGDKDAANTYRIFEVTGDVIVLACWGVVNTDLTEAGATAVIQVGVTGNTAQFMDQKNAVDLDDGKVWVSSSIVIGGETILAGYRYTAINDGADIVETVGTQDVTGGQIDYYCIWAPVEPGASVVSSGTLSQV